MTSSRTLYRQKRVQLVKDCMMLLADMLTLEKKELERIKLPFFKQLKKTIEKREFEKFYASRFYHD